MWNTQADLAVSGAITMTNTARLTYGSRMEKARPDGLSEHVGRSSAARLPYIWLLSIPATCTNMKQHTDGQ
jgi:hypothetical protein